jgi:hypothetical protein
MRLLSAFLVVLALTAITNSVLAKGENYITGARLSGGGLTSPQYVALQLPENYDEMYETSAAGASAADLPYSIVIYYDFGGTIGQRGWAGRFDGTNLLYFPEPILVGSGTWHAGWYQAGELFADPLQEAIVDPAFPAAGSRGERSGTTVDSLYAVLALSLASVLCLAIVGLRLKSAQ